MGQNQKFYSPIQLWLYFQVCFTMHPASVMLHYMLNVWRNTLKMYQSMQSVDLLSYAAGEPMKLGERRNFCTSGSPNICCWMNRPCLAQFHFIMAVLITLDAHLIIIFPTRNYTDLKLWMVIVLVYILL